MRYLFDFGFPTMKATTKTNKGVARSVVRTLLELTTFDATFQYLLSINDVLHP